jgi:hypothetical protein
MFLDAIQHKRSASLVDKGTGKENADTNPTTTPTPKTGPAEKVELTNSSLSAENSSSSADSSKAIENPSHFAAALFLLGFFFVAVFGGLYIKRKLTGTQEDHTTKW